VLFDYLEEYENSTGEQIELDCIAICCDFHESTPEGIIEDYSLDPEEYDAEDTEKIIEYLQDHTSVCGETDLGTIVYQVF
jgi:hypothetical protein